ncbi:glycosyltransferase family 9 protein [Castellaniella sp.]|uniref:glycosyltransferase family 9 protein n=1 Tax=Castellaniella sp. TaxID=1955812 RepID=UPI0035627ED9
MARLAPRNPAEIAGVRQMAEASQRVAVVLAPRLGDSLLMLTIAQNLRAAGREVCVYGDYARALADWLPGLAVCPALAEAQATETLRGFDLCLQMHVDWPFSLCAYHPQALYYDGLVRVTGRGFTKLDQIVRFCHHYLGLTQATADDGMRAPEPHSWRRHPRRVVIHPTSTGAQRCWAPRHFRTLGLRLQDQGFEPCYIVSPAERPDWLWVRELGLGLPELPSLSAVAGFIHQSGWFIGNESGIGHLSSSVGVPTLSLTGRPTRTRCWLPAWSPAAFVYPKWLIGGRLRDRYWRTALTPGEVLRAFARLRAQVEEGLQPPGFLGG